MHKYNILLMTLHFNSFKNRIFKSFPLWYNVDFTSKDSMDTFNLQHTCIFLKEYHERLNENGHGNSTKNCVRENISI